MRPSRSPARCLAGFAAAALVLPAQGAAGQSNVAASGPAVLPIDSWTAWGSHACSQSTGFALLPPRLQ